MAKLSALKLVAAARPVPANAVEFRRRKLVSKLEQQRDALVAMRKGDQATVMRKRWRVDPNTGQREQVNVARPVRQWFWQTQEGHYQLSVRYGARVLELGKGKTAVQAANLDELYGAIEMLIECVNTGELDGAIATASASVRGGFAKKGK